MSYLKTPRLRALLILSVPVLGACDAPQLDLDQRAEHQRARAIEDGGLVDQRAHQRLLLRALQPVHRGGARGRRRALPEMMRVHPERVERQRLSKRPVF